jgi:hypothetical protein
MAAQEVAHRLDNVSSNRTDDEERGGRSAASVSSSISMLPACPESVFYSKKSESGVSVLSFSFFFFFERPVCCLCS